MERKLNGRLGLLTYCLPVSTQPGSPRAWGGSLHLTAPVADACPGKLLRHWAPCANSQLGFCGRDYTYNRDPECGGKALAKRMGRSSQGMDGEEVALPFLFLLKLSLAARQLTEPG